MHIVYVKHYLDPEGFKHFEENWFPEVMATITKQPGYISCTHDKELDVDDCLNLTVKFDSEDNLNQWIATDAHAALIDGLDPYWLRGRLDYVITTDEATTRNELEWVSATPNKPRRD